MPKELEESFSEIVQYLKRHPKYLEYLALSKKVGEHEEIKELITTIKRVQKELVRLEYYGKDCAEKQEEYHTLLNDLQDYPLYCSYINCQKEVNSMLQYVKTQVEDAIFEIVNS